MTFRVSIDVTGSATTVKASAMSEDDYDIEENPSYCVVSLATSLPDENRPPVVIKDKNFTQQNIWHGGSAMT